MVDDYLTNSSYPECHRASDVTYVNLFNPVTLEPIAVSNLAQPVTFKIEVSAVINMTTANLKCHTWDKSSSSWTTLGAAAVSKNQGSRSVECTANNLGYFLVLNCDAENITASTTTAPVTSKPATTQYNNSSDSQASDAGSTTAAPATSNEAAGTTNSPVDSSSTISSSGQGSTDPPATNKEAPQNIQFSIDAKFNDVVNPSNKEKFENLLIDKIAAKLKIRKSRIWNFAVRPGSIVVSFVLLPGADNETDVKILTNTLKTMVENDKLNLTTTDGKSLKVIISSFSQSVASISTAQPQPTSKKLDPVNGDESEMQLEVLIGIIAGACLVVILMIVVILYCRSKSKQRVKDCDDELRKPPPGVASHEGGVPLDTGDAH